MRADLSYQCTDCGELFTRVVQGACPTCGSQAVLPLGWFQISIRERKNWLQRIRGLRRFAQERNDSLHQEDEPDRASK